ncbi:DUF6000 family protein [Streptomyces sp. NPDC014656]|uniref:DUF6000 family protein n=1 Tax=Streptomyces sp. NPDC014656 TaxID=3364878 RepID=UPI0036FB6CDE
MRPRYRARTGGLLLAGEVCSSGSAYRFAPARFGAPAREPGADRLLVAFRGVRLRVADGAGRLATGGGHFSVPSFALRRFAF